GDCIVASGLNDGTGVAVSPEEMTANQHSLVVGQAWESSSAPGVKLINTVVGSPSTLSPALHRLTGDMSQLKLANDELRQRLEALEALLLDGVGTRAGEPYTAPLRRAPGSEALLTVAGLSSADR
ncbi:MAG: hypothetical protein V3T83_02830, partial [Acidobacteriota bacterium]